MLRIAAVASLTAIWFVCRYYLGIQHDARLYVGRALADLHPDTIGQEIAFTHDGQSGFSIFPLVMRLAVQALGAPDAAMLVTFTGLVVWVLAAGALLTRFMRGPLLWASLAVLAAVPADYGGYSIFRIAEAFATPRIYAEAAGLLALAALLRGSKLGFFLLTAVSALLHPIMALPIATIGFVMLIIEDRRWIAPPLLALSGLILAIVLKVPIASRFTEQFDPAWLGVINTRGLVLFPLRWLSSNWAVLIQQVALLGILCRICNPPLRTIVVVAVAATTIGLLLPSLYPSVLVTQAQTWRAQWLLAFLAPATLPLTISLLYERGGAYRALIPLVLSIPILPGNMGVTLLTGVAAHLCLFSPQRILGHPIIEKVLWTIWGLATAANVALQVAVNQMIFHAAPAVAAPEGFHRLLIVLLQKLAAALIIILVVYPREGRIRPPAAVLAVVSVLAAMWSLATWDMRPSYTRHQETGDGSRALRAALPYGSVRWLGDSGLSWYWTGRPDWLGEFSGSGVVFDRNLALEWKRRRDAMVDAGLMERVYTLDPRLRRKLKPIESSAESIGKLCTGSPRPDWVVAPIGEVDGGIKAQRVPEGLMIWRAPAPNAYYDRTKRDWIVVRDYVVVPCRRAPQSPSPHV